MRWKQSLPALIEKLHFLLQTEDYEKALDVIELTFRVIDRSIRNNLYHYNQRLGGGSNPLIRIFLSDILFRRWCLKSVDL